MAILNKGHVFTEGVLRAAYLNDAFDKATITLESDDADDITIEIVGEKIRLKAGSVTNDKVAEDVVEALVGEGLSRNGKLLNIQLADGVLSIGPDLSLAGITGADDTATATTDDDHGLSVGDRVIISGCDQGEYNGIFDVASTPTTTTFTYVTASSITVSPATGSPAAKLSKIQFSVADRADVESETGERPVIPGIMRYHPAFPVAWASAQGDGTILQSLGVASIERYSDGDYTVTLSEEMSGTDYCIITTMGRSTSSGYVVCYEILSATQFNLHVSADFDFSFCVFGPRASAE
ncbi:hypothetical protein [Ruficoccus sp. ZRK36]|uniref:hypothetical protein n=1 Tax=Ruficoccus sp. ZRK36 TaxID=2866311 RepID=UPI001C72DDA6|nr:hypothetical protein [Ruficoccus sp. ZRK36]QYY35319.1 hypothetical protein K0V07_13585 [Ruficoccus sp. ZRK36]